MNDEERRTTYTVLIRDLLAERRACADRIAEITEVLTLVGRVMPPCEVTVSGKTFELLRGSGILREVKP